MERQLALLESPPVWRLSEHTREIGRRGVASARAALAAATPDARRSSGVEPAEQEQDRSAA